MHQVTTRQNCQPPDRSLALIQPKLAKEMLITFPRLALTFYWPSIDLLTFLFFFKLRRSDFSLPSFFLTQPVISRSITSSFSLSSLALFFFFFFSFSCRHLTLPFPHPPLTVINCPPGGAIHLTALHSWEHTLSLFPPSHRSSLSASLQPRLVRLTGDSLLVEFHLRGP